MINLLVKKLGYLIIITGLFFGCENEEKKSRSSGFVSFINSQNVIESKNIDIPKKSSKKHINKSFRLIVNDQGEIVVVDESNWSLHLLNNSGKIIDSTGRTGKGPGEYLQINDIFIDENKYLNVLDLKSKRITKYNISNQSFERVEIINLPEYYPLFPKSYYFSNKVRVGVFNELTYNKKGVNNRQVYRLKDNLELEAKITKLPGDEKIAVQDNWIQKPLGQTFYWDIDKDRLYFNNNKSLTIRSINLVSGQRQTYDLTEGPIFKNTKETQSYLKDFFRPLGKVFYNINEIIEETESLPLSTKFLIHDKFAYFTIFNPSNKKGNVLRVNIITGDINVIRVPSRFVLYDVYEDKLFGVNHETNEVAVIKLLEANSG